MESKEDFQNWRFWPVLCLAFIFAFSSPLIMLATPIYFFQQGLQLKFISFLSTAITITYSFSPMIFVKLSNKLGRKKSIIISMLGATLAQFTYYFTLDPVFFLIERLFEGFILGFFFPNLMASISDDPSLDHNKYLAKFNLAWSSAIVFGLIFGTVFLLVTNDLKFMFYINPIFLLINTILAILFFQNPVKSNISTHNINNELKNDQQKLNNQFKYYIPIIIPILFIFTMSLASGISGFLYPIKSQILGFHPASAYFLSIFSTSTQTLGMYLASRIEIKKLKVFSIFSIISLAIVVIFYEINDVYLSFIALFILLGFFAGIIYGTASRLFINLNVIKQTSIYSSLSESLVGVAFFITQVSAGFLADIDLGLAFYSFTLVLIILFFLTLVLIRKVKMN